VSTREVGDTAGAARRMIRALGRRCGQESPEDLELIVALRAEVEAALTAAMEGQRAAGFSLREVGRPIGMSKQAVAQRLASDARHGVA
jgi:hypothetical protein